MKIKSIVGRASLARFLFQLFKFVGRVIIHQVQVDCLLVVLGRQANLKESSKSKELAELRLQVLVVVQTRDACESKKEIMRLKSDL